MRDNLLFLNVVRVFPDNLDFTMAEIRRQHQEVGLNDFALCLSFHPTGTPAKKNAEALVDNFRIIKEAFKGTPDIHIGVLIQSTLGHGWSGPVPLTGETWQRIVSADGTVSSRMCPIDSEFREYVKDTVAAIMEVGPAFLLLDDDFGLRFGECFCPHHIDMFNKAAGTSCTREEVVELLKQRPADDPLVQLFSRQRGELIISFAKEIREVIDRYDDSIMCIMCTPGGGHGFVNNVTHILAGRHGTPAARVNNAIYGSNQPLGLAFLSTTTNRIRTIFKDVPVLIDEADTFPQTYLSENAVLFNAHLVNAVLNGLDGAKLWMFEYEMPEDTQSQACYEAIFREYRGFYEELYQTVKTVQWLGVKTPLIVPSNMLYPLKEVRIYGSDWTSQVWGAYGVPFAYDTPDGNGLFALNRDLVSQLSDNELMALFAQRLLIDSEAAKLLVERGFGNYMGIRIGDSPRFFFQAEKMAEQPSPAGLMWEPSCAELICLSEQTQVASWCLNRDLTTNEWVRVSPAMTFFTNPLGGRIVTLAWSSAMPAYKLHRHERRRAVMAALDLLQGTRFEMSLETAHQALVRHGKLTDATELVAIISLALDSSPDIRLRMAAAPKVVESLQPDGIWQTVASHWQDGLLTVDIPLTVCKPVALKIMR